MLCKVACLSLASLFIRVLCNTNQIQAFAEIYQKNIEISSKSWLVLLLSQRLLILTTAAFANALGAGARAWGRGPGFGGQGVAKSIENLCME
jgi:hypothetical protein